MTLEMPEILLKSIKKSPRHQGQRPSIARTFERDIKVFTNFAFMIVSIQIKFAFSPTHRVSKLFTESKPPKLSKDQYILSQEGSTFFVHSSCAENTMGKNWLVVGICGVTCGGKTSLVKQIKDDFPGTVVIAQDDYFLPPGAPNQVLAPGLNHINYELMCSLDMERMREDVQKALDQQPTEKHWPVMIIEGFSLYRDPWIKGVCDVKFFITLDREECYRRRIVRVYEPPDPPGYFEAAVWPEYLKIAEEAFAINGLIKLDGKQPKKDMTAEVLQHIQRELQ